MVTRYGADPSGAMTVVAALLLLQAGIGLVAAAGMLPLVGAPGGGERLLLALAAPVLVFGLAYGIAWGRRWPRRLAFAYEVLVLLGALLRLLVDGRLALGLVVTLTGVVLPLAALVALRRAGGSHANGSTRP